jgi:uncharacterized OB-fold protein
MSRRADRPVLTGGPLPSPRPDGVDAPYWDALADDRLVVQRCDACGKRQFPPESFCRHCRSATLGWVDVEPVGTLFSWVRVWHPLTPGQADDVPFVICVVDVVPGEVRVLGNLVDPPAGELPIGAPVAAVFEHHDEIALLQWELGPGA